MSTEVLEALTQPLPNAMPKEWVENGVNPVSMIKLIRKLMRSDGTPYLKKVYDRFASWDKLSAFQAKSVCNAWNMLPPELHSKMLREARNTLPASLIAVEAGLVDDVPPGATAVVIPSNSPLPPPTATTANASAAPPAAAAAAVPQGFNIHDYARLIHLFADPKHMSLWTSAHQVY